MFDRPTLSGFLNGWKAEKTGQAPRVNLVFKSAWSPLSLLRCEFDPRNSKRHVIEQFVLVCGLFFLVLPYARAQQEVFNVPSADVLDRGKTYVEWDATVGDASPSAALTPRSVYGVGHNVEVGVNVSSFNLPSAGVVAVVPVVKWKFYENQEHGLALFSGLHVSLPYHEHGWKVGEYAYVEAAKTFKTGTRMGAGFYDCSAHVAAERNRTGTQASIEQAVNPRLSIAADWYSGNNSVGFLTPGVAYKMTAAWTLYTAYEVGNHAALHGNHALLLELGWNPQWTRRARAVR